MCTLVTTTAPPFFLHKSGVVYSIHYTDLFTHCQHDDTQIILFISKINHFSPEKSTKEKSYTWGEKNHIDD